MGATLMLLAFDLSSIRAFLAFHYERKVAKKVKGNDGR